MNVNTANMWYNKFNSPERLFVTGFALGSAALLWVLFWTTPSGPMIPLFYLAIAATAFCALTLANFYFRRLTGQREFQHRYLRAAMRQSLWLTLVVLISLALSSYGMFSWLNAAFLVFVFVFLESYLLTKNSNQ